MGPGLGVLDGIRAIACMGLQGPCGGLLCPCGGLPGRRQGCWDIADMASSPPSYTKSMSHIPFTVHIFKSDDDVCPEEIYGDDIFTRVAVTLGESNFTLHSAGEAIPTNNGAEMQRRLAELLVEKPAESHILIARRAGRGTSTPRSAATPSSTGFRAKTKIRKSRR